MQMKKYVLILVALGLAAWTARAANLYWDGPTAGGTGDGASQGGTATWDTSTMNWDAGSGLSRVAWTNLNNDTAIFGGTAGIVTLFEDVQVGGLTFSTSGYTITGAKVLKFGVANSLTVNTGTLTISGGAQVFSGAAASYIGNGTANNTVWVVGGSGVTSLWNLGNQELDVGSASGGGVVNNKLVIDGAGVGGSAVVTNVNVFQIGQSAANCSVLLTNGARMFVNSGEIRMGRIYYNQNSTNNLLSIVGGAADSIFYGSSSPFYVGYGDRAGASYNQVYVGSGGILTNVGNADFVLGQAANVQNGDYPACFNRLVVTDGGKAFLLGNLSVGYATVTRQANSNAVLISSGGLVNVPGAVNVGYANAGGATDNCNSVTITNGGQFYAGAASYIGRASNNSGAMANNNTLWVGGANALCDLGGANLYVGYAGNAAAVSTGNVLTVSTGGVMTNVSGLIVGMGASALSNQVVMAGGNIYAASMTVTNGNQVTLNAGGGALVATNGNITFKAGTTLSVNIGERQEAPSSRLAAGGTLTISGVTLNLSAPMLTPPNVPAYIIGSYGTLAGEFSVTNGLPWNWKLNYNYNALNQIALLPPPPSGFVITLR